MNREREILRVVAEMNGFNLKAEDEADKQIMVLEGLERHRLWEPCIFESCCDEDVQCLLNNWLEGKLIGDRDLELQLSFLLAARGRLVYDKAFVLFERERWVGFNPRQLALSFICNIPNYPQTFRSLLSQMSCDFRDGLFVSAWQSARTDIDQILIDSFSNWYRAGDWEPAGTAEDAWLEAFLKRWMNLYDVQRLAIPLKAYFDVCV